MHEVDVVEPAGGVVGARCGRGGDRLHLPRLQVVDPQAALFGGGDHQAAVRVGGVAPDRGVVGVGVAARLVVVQRGGLRPRSDGGQGAGTVRPCRGGSSCGEGDEGRGQRERG